MATTKKQQERNKMIIRVVCLALCVIMVLSTVTALFLT